MGTNPATTTATTATDLLLATGTWPLDAAHSGVHFKVRHIGLSNVRGRFNRFDAMLSVGETLADTRVEATIEMSSVDTNQPDRDAHLLGTDFFSADQHPLMTFRSTGIRAAGDGGYALDGELTLNGVTRPVALDVEFFLRCRDAPRRRLDPRRLLGHHHGGPRRLRRRLQRAAGPGQVRPRQEDRGRARASVRGTRGPTRPGRADARR
jgi:polyisoprenoid-binding protein YceI